MRKTKNKYIRNNTCCRKEWDESEGTELDEDKIK